MNFLINRSLSKTLAVIAVAAALMGAANVARATLINVTVDSSGNLLHTVGIADKDQYKAASGSNGNNNPGTNFDFLVTEVGYYNAFNPDLPAPDSTPSAINTPAANIENINANSYTTLAGWDYVVFHFGAGKAGSSGGYWQAFYLGGDSVSFAAVPQIAGQSVGGFSSARYFSQDVHVVTHNVPDSGSTVIPLGLALLAIGLVARKKKVG